MNKGIVVVLVIAAIIGSLCVFTVDERERAILFQLGQIVRTDYQPGLHFKLPVPFQNVRKFDNRIQNLDADPELYLTSERKNVNVDSFVKWRIGNVEAFYKANVGDIRIANDTLSTIIQKLLKDEFGTRTVRQVVSGERSEIMESLIKLAQTEADGLGIHIVDVRIKRIVWPVEVSGSVYQRMAAERKEEAKKRRSQGQESAKIIQAAADRERAVILAEAQRDGQVQRGSGDGQAAEIYANAYTQDREFYDFYRSLVAYKTTFRSRSDILLLQPDADFFKYFKSPHAPKESP
jgi:membrane protease subunit HflC